MKLWLDGFLMCQSMFCAIPCPINRWNEDARKQMLLCLPFVGLEIGAVWFAAGWLCQLLGLNQLLTGLAIALCPYLLTGWLHLDGFMDVTDAVRSYRSLERRREILKDSHVGSFAVIGVAMLLLSQFAVCASLPKYTNLGILVLIPAASRCCSVIAVSRLPKMPTSQYAAVEAGSIPILPVIILAALLALGFWIDYRWGISLCCCILGYLLALRKAYRSLQGMNGDISGYALSLSELTALTALAVL